MLTTLAQPKGYSPDFLTPAEDVSDLDTGLELLLSTPRTQLRADITRLADEATIPTWVSGVADGEPHIMRRLVDAIRGYYADALKPYWSNIRHHVRADQRRRAEIVVTHGLETMFETLHSSIRWQAPVLEVAYPVEQDLHLEGRGLSLAPSFFCWRTSITLANESARPMLVYPVEHDPNWIAPTEEATYKRVSQARSLTALLGRTRATVLRTIADNPRVNTTELARIIGISPSGASQHATVLRKAGLVNTTPQQGSAVHQVSLLGASLLRP
jgi:DNA-binding transcriptional ArsR family regulator